MTTSCLYGIMQCGVISTQQKAAREKKMCIDAEMFCLSGISGKCNAM